MAFKEKLELGKERLLIEWRAMGKTKYLPFIVNYVLTPIGAAVYKKIKGDYYIDYVKDQLVFFVPLVGVWWILLIIQQHLEGNGREILHISGKSKAADILTFYGIYILTLVPIFSYILEITPRALIVILTLILKTLMFIGIFYMISMLSGSISYGFIVVFVLSLFMDNRLDKVFRLFGTGLTESSPGYGLTGLVCMIIGISTEKFLEKKY